MIRFILAALVCVGVAFGWRALALPSFVLPGPWAIGALAGVLALAKLRK